MKQDIKPRFQVEKLKGKRMKPVVNSKADKDGKLLGGFEHSEIEVDAGWMVYFPNGASVHIWTEEDMIAEGFMRDPELVDMNSGDVIGTTAETDLKALSEQKTNRSRSSQVAQT